MKFTDYKQYTWVYVLGAVVMGCNGLWLHSNLVGNLCLAVLFSILFYKGMHILLCYKKTSGKHLAMDKQAFTKTYRLFRLGVALYWLAFIALCLVGKLIFEVERQYFYCCTFFFLFLDRWFVNVICLLQKFCDPKGKTVICCCGCPCRGWDLMMIHTPLLFALDGVWRVETALIVLSSVLAVASLICWERYKYQLVEVRHKCPKECDLKLCREHL